MVCMDELIGDENPVRVIDALVIALNIKQHGFVKPKPEYDENDSACWRDMGGCPCYRSEDQVSVQ